MYESFFAIKATERTLRLREAYLHGPLQTQTHPFFYSGDRWMTLPFLEGWLKYHDELTTVMRRAKTEAYVLDQYQPVILEDELIVGQMDHHILSEEEDKRFQELYKMFEMSPYIHPVGRTDHVCLDYEKLLRCGVNGLLKEIEENRAKLDFSNQNTISETVEKDEFYESAAIELKALLNLAKRYAAYAREMSAKSKPERAIELIEIANTLDHVPAEPARTFREALQSCHFYTYNLFGLYPSGHPDCFLYPFYQQDIESGLLTNETAQELIDNYCMQFSQYSFSSAANGYIVGGRDSEGKLVQNELTAMFLNSIRHIHMALPEVAFAINSETCPELINESLKIISEGHTHPALYNDDTIVKSLIAHGVPKKDAYQYVNTTCVEITLCGKSDAWTTCPWHNLMRIFMELFNQISFDSVEEFYRHFEEAVRIDVMAGIRKIRLLQLERSRNGAMPLRTSCLVQNCIERGKSLAQGGAKYNWVYPTFVGMPNVVDSLVAIDYVVFKQKLFSLEEFKSILAHNFDGHEALHTWIVNKVPHLGNGENECDIWMKRLMDFLDKLCENQWTYRQDFTIPGAFSYSMHYRYGEKTPTSPDGRLKGTPVANSAACMQGCDTNGPTALLLSASEWNQSHFLGGVATNITMTKRLFEGEGINAVRSLVETYFQRGGLQLQFTTADRTTLLDAVEHPENHRDLIVRVGGYSEYFTRLVPSLQQELIQRTTY